VQSKGIPQNHCGIVPAEARGGVLAQGKKFPFQRVPHALICSIILLTLRIKA